MTRLLFVRATNLFVSSSDMLSFSTSQGVVRMAAINLLTLIFELLSPLVVTLLYLTFFGKRRSKFIEAFIVLMYVKTVSTFIYYLWYLQVSVPSYFDAGIDGIGLGWQFLMDFIFQFVYTLQEYLTWVMVSFFAVLFGMIVLALKLTLQDPVKMRFKNVIKRVVGSEPESDGYSGLRDRLEDIKFEGVEPQPLDPEVQATAWRQAWRDYLIIGLATLLPSIGAYMGNVVAYTMYLAGHPDALAVLPDPYVIGVLIFLTWIYRFGYTGSNRIARGSGIKLGNRDLGGEMMRGVLGWFFRLNIILSLVFIYLNISDALTSPILLSAGAGWTGLAPDEILFYVGLYFRDGIMQAFPPILFAIIILPLVEDFAVVLYKKVFEGVTRVRSRTWGFNPRRIIKNLGASVSTGFLITGAFIGAVMAVTLNYARTVLATYEFWPVGVEGQVANDLSYPAGNVALIPPTIWILMMLAIPFASMLLLGLIGHFVRTRVDVSSEGFALFSGLTVSIATWLITWPGMDYILNVLPTPATIAGETFYRLRPVIYLPQADQLLFRLASQFVVNLPIYVFTVLFILYFFQFRERWKVQIGEVSGPLLNVQRSDIYQVLGLFFGGLILSIVGVWIVTFIIDPALMTNTLLGLFSEIGDPNGLEGVLAHFAETQLRSPFLIIAEHNMIRTLLMLILGPIFWSAVLYVAAVKEKSKSDHRNEAIGILLLLVGIVVSFIWTLRDMRVLVFIPAAPLDWSIPLALQNPWTFAAHLGLRAAVIFGFLLGAYFLGTLYKKSRGGSANAYWFPVFLAVYALEYFIYDDQFTVIALFILPMILAGAYKIALRGREEVRSEDFLLTYIRFGLMSLAIAEVLSTALIIGGVSIIRLIFEGSALPFLAQILPHAIIEIPVFLLAAATSLRIAKDLGPHIQNEEWSAIPSKTRELVTDERTWRTYALIVFFLLISALIEAYVTPIIFDWVIGMPA
ncbi:MAG: stage II sporulation protein M [Candidatus Thorarchaeota archaeon]|nr:stage II sporulation protein M [Candidatus Thorarchaeota archaeon]